MKDEVLVSDEGGERKSGERFGEDLEDALVVFVLAFAFEAVHSVHIVRLVVAAIEEH